MNSIKLIYETTEIQETAQELLTIHKSKPGPEPKSKEEAKKFLTETLQKGILPRKMIEKLAEIQNIPMITIYRAKNEMKIKGIIPKTGLHKGKKCWQVYQDRDQ